MKLQLTTYHVSRYDGRNPPRDVAAAVTERLEYDTTNNSYGAGHLERVAAMAEANRVFLAGLTEALHKAGALPDAAVLDLLGGRYEVAP